MLILIANECLQRRNIAAEVTDHDETMSSLRQTDTYRNVTSCDEIIGGDDN
jgi:hypothetical protein